MLRLVGGDDSLADGLQQYLKRGAVRVFGGVTTREVLLDVVKVCPEGGHQKELAIVWTRGKARNESTAQLDSSI